MPGQLVLITDYLTEPLGGGGGVVALLSRSATIFGRAPKTKLHELDILYKKVAKTALES